MIREKTKEDLRRFVLLIIEHPGLSQQELAKRLGVHQSAVSNFARSLEHAGLVKLVRKGPFNTVRFFSNNVRFGGAIAIPHVKQEKNVTSIDLLAPGYLTLSELAKKHNVTRSSVYHDIDYGFLKPTKDQSIMRRMFVTPEAERAWLEAKTDPAKTPAVRTLPVKKHKKPRKNFFQQMFGG